MLTARLSFAEPLFVNIFTCKARKASKDELASLLTELCIKTATEPGCRRCDYMVANKDALTHTMIQVYDSFDEWSKHERTPHGRKFFQKSPNLMASHWHTSCVSWYPVTPAGFALPPYLRQGMGDSISASEMAISVVTLAVKPHLDLQVLDAAKRKSQVSLENRLLLEGPTIGIGEEAWQVGIDGVETTHQAKHDRLSSLLQAPKAPIGLSMRSKALAEKLHGDRVLAPLRRVKRRSPPPKHKKQKSSSPLPPPPRCEQRRPRRRRRRSRPDPPHRWRSTW